MDIHHRRTRAATQFSLLSLGLVLALQAQAQQAAADPADPADPAPGKSAKTLDAIQVTGERTTSWTVPQTAAATRLSLTPQDTPQSLTIVTQQRIEDQSLQSVRDVLDNVTGVFSNAYDTERVVFYARGFQIENMSYDGVPIASSLNSSSADGSLDTVIYDRIEILRGATGLLSGAGSPSASINFIRKHANARDFTGEASLSAGSWDTWRGTVDLSTALNQSGSVRGRFVGAYEQGGSYLDRYSTEKKVAYGVIDADLGEATTLSVGYDFQQTDPQSVTWGSYPVFYDDGGFIEWRRGFNTSTDWSYWKNRTQTAFADLTHRFGSGWQLRGLASHRRTEGDSQLFYVYGWPNRETGEGLDPFAYLANDAGRQDNLDVYASGPFQLGGREHELVVGATGSRYRRNTDEYAYDDIAPVGNFLEWNGHFPKPVFADQADRVTTVRTDQSGLYAAARFSLADALKLIAGARYSRYKNDTDDVYSGVFHQKTNETVPYAGLVYAIDPTWSVFASYTEIFNPQNNRRASGAYLDPVEGTSYEIGLKGRHFDGRLNSSLVLFDTRQDNVAEADPGQYLPDGMTQAYIAVNGTRSRGAELDLAGDLTERWNASLGGSYFDLEGPDGAKLRTALPRTLWRAFTTYRLPMLDALTIGGGVNWQSSSHAPVDGPNGPQQVNQSSVTLVSLMARYQFNPQAELQLNADNLLDEKYFVLDEYSNLYYAAPVSATLSFRYRF